MVPVFLDLSEQPQRGQWIGTVLTQGTGSLVAFFLAGFFLVAFFLLIGTKLSFGL
jgi:hypothetical protein